MKVNALFSRNKAEIRMCGTQKATSSRNQVTTAKDLRHYKRSRFYS